MHESHEALLKIQADPLSIQYFDNPTQDLQLLAVDLNPHAIQFIKMPTLAVIEIALTKDPTTIQYIDHPTFKELFYAYELDTSAKDPSIHGWKQFFAWLLSRKVILM